MNIAPPGVCACSAYAGVVFTAFLQGRRTSPACFSPLLLLLLPPPPPAPSFFASLAASMLPSPRVRINSYNYITRWRDHYSWQTFLFSPFPFSIPPSCFLFQKTTTRKKSSFPRGRLTLGSNREGWDLEGISARPFHHKRVLSCNHDLSRHVYTPVGIAAAYRGQGFLGIRGNTLERGWTVPRR